MSIAKPLRLTIASHSGVPTFGVRGAAAVPGPPAAARAAIHWSNTCFMDGVPPADTFMTVVHSRISSSSDAFLSVSLIRSLSFLITPTEAFSTSLDGSSS